MWHTNTKKKKLHLPWCGEDWDGVVDEPWVPKPPPILSDDEIPTPEVPPVAPKRVLLPETAAVPPDPT